MATTHTCTTPEEGWGLYSNLLGNLLAAISILEESDKNKRERIISEIGAQLVGYLYITMRQMKIHGHDEVAVKMQQIVDMVAEQDLNDPEVRKAIFAKHTELDVSQQQFNAELEKLRAERRQ